MPSRALERLVLLLLASAGCAEAVPPTGDGRLDLTVVPESLLASGRPLQGSFELRGWDRASTVAVPVDGAGYQTHSVALAPGVYSLRWRPLLQPSFSEQAARAALEAQASAARSVVIASNRVTTLTVHSTIHTDEAAQPVAAIASSPEPHSQLTGP